MTDINQSVNRINEYILDAIEMCSDEKAHLVVYALISTGAKLAVDCSPNREEAGKIVDLALADFYDDLQEKIKPMKAYKLLIHDKGDGPYIIFLPNKTEVEEHLRCHVGDNYKDRKSEYDLRYISIPTTKRTLLRLLNALWGERQTGFS